jgi:hypothetical protein
MSNPENILYKIRNGKNFVTNYVEDIDSAYETSLSIVLESITKGIEKNVKGKKIYIPEYITYAIPNSEKQFFGNFPYGTCVTVPDNMVFGIHWFDKSKIREDRWSYSGNRVDLDLSLLNNDGYKVGWNAYYRSDDRNILFSGDMTSAPKPNGASELFYVKSNKDFYGVLYVNYYNSYDKKSNVDFKVFVGRDTIGKLDRNYMIDPNHILAVDSTNFAEGQQKLLGLVAVSKNECKFYYVGGNTGGRSTSWENEVTRKTRQFLLDFYSSNVTFNEVLKTAGADLVNSKDNCDIDLSPEALEKDTLIKLLVP